MQKIALYAEVVDQVEQVTHSSRQLPCGKWTSKLGDCEDIVHPKIDALEGPEYGMVICFLSRPRAKGGAGLTKRIHEQKA